VFDARDQVFVKAVRTARVKLQIRWADYGTDHIVRGARDTAVGDRDRENQCYGNGDPDTCK
jgi:hypothetical protein